MAHEQSRGFSNATEETLKDVSKWTGSNTQQNMKGMHDSWDIPSSL